MKTAREYRERAVTKSAMRFIQYNKAWDHNKAWPALRFVENPSCGLRFHGFVDKLDGIRVRHNGWFTDDNCDRVLRGVVYLLPHGKFVPGYACSDEWQGEDGRPHGACLSFPDATTDLDTAIRHADALAQSVAEDERAYNEIWQSGQDYARSLDEIADAWNGLRDLARERRRLKKGGGDFPVIMRALEEKMNALLEIIRENKKLVGELLASYGSNNAFMEGAGL